MATVNVFDGLSQEKKDLVEQVVAQAIDAISEKNEIGETKVDFLSLQAILEKLNATKKQEKKNYEEVLKEQKEAEKEEAIANAKKNTAGIQTGNYIQFRTSGQLAILMVQAKTEKSIAVMMPEGFYGKKPNRYVRFEKVIASYGTAEEAQAAYEELATKESVAFEIGTIVEKKAKKSA